MIKVTLGCDVDDDVCTEEIGAIVRDNNYDEALKQAQFYAHQMGWTIHNGQHFCHYHSNKAAAANFPSLQPKNMYEDFRERVCVLCKFKDGCLKTEGMIKAKCLNKL